MNVLITSDIHINDFRAHNINGDPFFRLGQFDKLADRFIDLIREHGCKALIIAGDLIHVASPRPFIVNATARFLAKIAKVVPVYATHGQHDFDSRTSMNHDNSLLSVLDNIDNVHYVDRDSVEFGGKSFYFQGWTPNQDFSHIRPNQYDVLIGHATVDDAVINDYGTKMPGQKYENDKFRLCFMGDIHRHQVKGNQVIPGVPIQNNFGDAPNTGVIIFDTEAFSWKRVPVDGGSQKFLKFIVTANPTGEDYTVTKPPPGHESSARKETLARSLNIQDIISDCISKQNLTDLHEQAYAATDKLEDESLSLLFQYERVVIRNFRSIDFLEWAPTSGVTIVNGMNGTGKSSLIEAIRFGEEGAGKPKDFVRHGCDLMSVDISRRYGDLSYRTVRGANKGVGFTKYYIDDEEIPSENQPALKSRIENDLRYISMFDIMYHSQDRPRFLSSYSYQLRVDLISRIIGLSIVDKLKKTAEKLRSGSDSVLNLLNTELSSIAMFIQSMENLDFSDLNHDYEGEIANLTTVSEVLTSYMRRSRIVSQVESEQQALKMALDQYPADMFNDRNEFDTEAYTAQVSTLKGELSDLESQSKKHRLERDKFTERFSQTQSTIQINNSKLYQLNVKLSKLTLKRCYACDQEIDACLHDKLRAEIVEEQSSITEQTEKLTKLTPSMSAMVSRLATAIDESSRLQGEKRAEISALEYQKGEALKLESQYQRYLSTQRSLAVKSREAEQALNSINDLQRSIKFDHAITISSVEDVESKLNEVNVQIATFKERQANQAKLKGLQSDMREKKVRKIHIDSEIARLQSEKIRWDRYVSMMSPNGAVTRSVLTTLSDQLSNESIRVIAYKTLASGETRPDFTLQMNVPEIGWIGYDTLSGGQRTVCDIFILYHLISIVGGCGLLVLDETLGQLDPENLEFCVNALKAMPVTSTIIVTHHENFPYSDQTVLAKLENGVTRYNFN